MLLECSVTTSSGAAKHALWACMCESICKNWFVVECSVASSGAAKHASWACLCESIVILGCRNWFVFDSYKTNLFVSSHLDHPPQRFPQRQAVASVGRISTNLSYFAHVCIQISLISGLGVTNMWTILTRRVGMLLYVCGSVLLYRSRLGWSQSRGRRLQPNRSTLLEIFNTMDAGDYVDCCKSSPKSGHNDADAKAKAHATQSKGERFLENAHAIHERAELERKWCSREKEMIKWKFSRLPTMRRQMQNFIALDLLVPKTQQN